MFVSKLLHSIVGSDVYILIAAVVTAVLLAFALWVAKKNTKRDAEWQIKNNVDFSLDINRTLTVTYSLFTTLISLFPLFGMFGTVVALLGLDLSAGELEGVKGSFFDALTSTAWGIIFSVIFKIAHALVADFIEKQIVSSAEVAEIPREGPPKRQESKKK